MWHPIDFPDQLSPDQRPKAPSERPATGEADIQTPRADALPEPPTLPP